MITIILSIIIFIGLLILDIYSIVKKMHSNVVMLQQRFVATEKHFFDFIDLMPLSYHANELRVAINASSKAFDNALRMWERLDLKELEEFEKTNPPEDKAFIPSERLKEALKKWAKERYITNTVNDWRELYKETYVELLSGKIPLEDAEQKLKCINLFSVEMDLIGQPKPEIEDIYNNWATRWSANEWRDRLKHLREIREQEK